ncbi:fimbrial biogenesis chaperone [Paraburkholderia rhizosphaerae]|uniref:Chaperone protein EcpD n=1 Tax=Paraburkholderia rhizosphaerae TaxID=480658 RepID=A0A4R8M200_9BURK|nr:fimbria/pilus periplasmic chaperone [Paraburkholderia rhizosphaerae]TDY53479.1 chaperone protein EcpD [Paraburkholderia rhizosphaerae]
MKYRTFNLIFKVAILTGLAVASFAVTTVARASIVIGATRVIYGAEASEVTVKLTNQGQAAALAQTWIDNGDPKAAPSTVSTPFALTPPVSRIDPGKAQTIRIFRINNALPDDRESVFYLNVLEIPPKPGVDEAGENHLQLAFRTRIKLFYRPAGIKSSAADAPKQLNWQWSRDESKATLTVTNPTSYHVTIASFEVKDANGATLGKSLDSDMIAPGASRSVPVEDAQVRPGEVVRFFTINDYGGEDQHETPIR